MSGKLAIDGGAAVRSTMLPYGRQMVDEEDVAAVAETLRSDWLTTGPKVSQFEAALAKRTGSAHAVAVSSGTTALMAAVHALGIGPGDEVIVSSLTFVASANCAAWMGATPVPCDVDPDSLLIDPSALEGLITPKTKALIAVDYAGNLCDYDRLEQIAEREGLVLVDDAAHALGGAYKGRPAGSLGRLNTFSFHPVKHVAAGEGGAVTTDDEQLAERVRTFRNHGTIAASQQRESRGFWGRQMVELGLNCRMSDIQCVLGLSQLAKLDRSIARRREIAARYDGEFADLTELSTPAVAGDVSHAYHLYVVRLNLERLRVDGEQVLRALRAEGIGATVHYMPFHLHPYYRERFGTREGQCPVAEDAYRRIVSLPMFPSMSDSDVDDVIAALRKVIEAYRI